MDLPHLLEHYGYLAVLLGTLAEGESMLLLGSYAAHRGYLQLHWVIFIAFVAAVVSDQAYFHLGRRYGTRWLERRPRLRAKVDTALLLIDRHGAWIVLGMRFMWGLRIALPLAMGMSGMRTRRYFALDLIAAALWAALFGSIGYAGSRALSEWVADLRGHEGWLIGLLVTLAVGILAWRWRPRRRR